MLDQDRNKAEDVLITKIARKYVLIKRRPFIATLVGILVAAYMGYSFIKEGAKDAALKEVARLLGVNSVADVKTEVAFIHTQYAVLKAQQISTTQTILAGGGVRGGGDAGGNHPFQSDRAVGEYKDWDLHFSTSANVDYKLPQNRVRLLSLLGGIQPTSGFGIASGPQVESPTVWMYTHGGSCFDIRRTDTQDWMTNPSEKSQSVFRVLSNGDVEILAAVTEPSQVNWKLVLNATGIRIVDKNTGQILRTVEFKTPG